MMWTLILMCMWQVMQHCFFYLTMYAVLLGLLAAGYASYQLLSGPSGPHPQRPLSAHLTAALTSGRPVFGLLGWSIVPPARRG